MSEEKKNLNREDFVKWGKEGIAKILSGKTEKQKSEYMKKVRKGISVSKLNKTT